MFFLTANDLDNALAAINHHAYSVMLPQPPEWDVLVANWSVIRDAIERIDLDTYKPFKVMTIYAPKSRANIRVMHLLHPQDLLIYTALVLIAKNDIEANRISIRTKRVFSYRADIENEQVLYKTRGSHESYRKQLEAKATNANVKFVALADIADFYPRIYQHRLKNIIEASANNQRVRDVARVLVDKLICKLLDGNSYGIPVGPYASRLLGEAILIDVDSTLQSQNINFVRWVDDYNIFCKTEYEAQSVLYYLGEWLFSKHGLTLQSGKTKILTIDKYRSGVLYRHEEQITDRDTVVDMLRDFSGYSNGEEEPEEEEIEEALAVLQGTDLKGMLEASMADTALVDYEAIKYALKKLPRIPGASPELKREVLELVIDNAKLLYPVAEHIAMYVLSFGDLTHLEQKRVATKLLRPLMNKTNPPPPYYAMWILHIFATVPAFSHARDVVSVYTNSTSDVIKRYAALAVNSFGNRSDALALKDDYVGASPLLRLAILFATQKLGVDERKHWKLANSVSGAIEKLI